MKAETVDAIYREHYGDLVNQLQRSLVTRDRAEDWAQEAFLALVQYPEDELANVRGWLVTVARRRAIDAAAHLHGKGKSKRKECDLAAAGSRLAVEPPALELLIMEEQVRRAQAVLASLHPTQRALYVRAVDAPESLTLEERKSFRHLRARLREGAPKHWVGALQKGRWDARPTDLRERRSASDRARLAERKMGLPPRPPGRPKTLSLGREVLAALLAEHGGHRGKTAAVLGVDRRTLQARIKEYGLIERGQHRRIA